MAALFFTCPETGQRVSTGVETDARSLRKSWRKKMRVECPHCGESHRIAVCETYLEQVLFETAPPAGVHLS